MLVLQGSRRSMLEALKGSGSETEILLKCKPSALLLAAVLNGTKAKRIMCSEGIRKTFTKKMLDALAGMNVAVETVSLKRGRPFEVGEKQVERARELVKRGKTVKQAAKGTGMSERTLYYWLAKAKRRV